MGSVSQNLACLEGIFACGMLYVGSSRCVRPSDFAAIGIPPADLLEDVAAAVAAAGLDIHVFFSAAASVTGNFAYAAHDGMKILDRFSPATERGRKKKYRIHGLERILDPQPRYTAYVRNILGWIEENGTDRQRSFPEAPKGDWWRTFNTARKDQLTSIDFEVSDSDSCASSDADSSGGDSNSEIGVGRRVGVAAPVGARLRRRLPFSVAHALRMVGDLQGGVPQGYVVGEAMMVHDACFFDSLTQKISPSEGKDRRAKEVARALVVREKVAARNPRVHPTIGFVALEDAWEDTVAVLREEDSRVLPPDRYTIFCHAPEHGGDMVGSGDVLVRLWNAGAGVPDSACWVEEGGWRVLCDATKRSTTSKLGDGITKPRNHSSRNPRGWEGKGKFCEAQFF